MEYKTGQVLNFAYSDTFFMKLILLGNKMHYKGVAKWTHSAIIGEVSDTQCLVYEADGKEIVKSQYDKSWLDEMVKQGKCAVGTPNAELKGVLEHCEKYLGDPYSWGSILDIAIYWFTGIQDVRNCDPNAFICSEFVAQVLTDSGMDIVKLTKLPMCLIAPMDLYECKEIQWLK